MSTHSPKDISVLLIDDHPIFRAGLRMLIESDARMKVVGEADKGSEALTAVRREQPNVILLDLDLSGVISLDLIPDLLAASQTSRILMLTGLRDIELHRSAVSLGARGVVLKEQAAETLLKAMETVNCGQLWPSPAISAQASPGQPHTGGSGPNNDPQKASIASLTKRERQIIALVGEGLKNQQVADRLGISEGTVRNHLTIIFEKLHLSGRFELVVFTHRYNLDNDNPKRAAY